jgi:hypothetical protein
MPIGRLPFLRRKQDDSSLQQRERFVRVVYQGLLHREPEDEALTVSGSLTQPAASACLSMWDSKK